MAAVRHGACYHRADSFDHPNVRPPTDVMAITSLPKAERQALKGKPGAGKFAFGLML